MSKTQIADTIIAQLGGSRFTCFTGAKNFFSINEGKTLSFTLPTGSTKNKSNFIKITLNGKDLYDVEFIRRYGRGVTLIKSCPDTACTELVSVFESETGLYTKF